MACPCGPRTSARPQSHGTLGSDEQNTITLTFRNAATETFFVREQVPAILRFLMFLCLTGALTCGGMMFQIVSFDTSNPGSQEVTRASVAANLTLLIFFLFGAVACKVPRVFARGPPYLAEVFAVVFICLTLAPVWFIDAWYAAKILGHDPKLIWPETNFSDTRPLLALTALVIGAHMVLPVRWTMLLPLAFTAVLCYAACAFVLVSPDGVNAWSSLLLFSAALAFPVMGRRSIEKHQREALIQVIHERSLRVQTEFQLSQMESRAKAKGDRHRRPEDDRTTSVGESVRESRPDTTDSAKIFDCADKEKVMQLGLKEQWCISRSELTMGSDVLGEGYFGSVVQGEFHGSSVAIKTAWAGEQLSQPGDRAEQTRIALLNEVRVLRRLRHPNVVLFHGVCMDDPGGGILLVLECLRGMSIERAVLQGDLHNQALDPANRLRAIQDICRALRHLHSRPPPVVHGDLKASNAFAEMVPGHCGLVRAKLLDFGLSRVLTRHAKPLGGSPMWMAPEVALKQCAPQLPSDVYSFGRFVYFVAAGTFPNGQMVWKSFKKFFQGGLAPPLVWPEDADAVSRALRPFAEACSRFEAGNRPTMQEVGQRLDDFDLEDLDVGIGFQTEILRPAPAPAPPPPAQPREAPLHTTGEPTAAASEVAPQVELALPSFKATSPRTTRVVLAEAISRINFSLPPGETPCCLHHAALLHLRGAIGDLQDGGCQNSPFEAVRAQCPFCQSLLHPEYDGILNSLRRHLGGARILRCPTCDTAVETNTVQAL